jgi:hypothetical protein
VSRLERQHTTPLRTVTSAFADKELNALAGLVPQIFEYGPGEISKRKALCGCLSEGDQAVPERELPVSVPAEHSVLNQS